jgi:hypothetical protein
MPAHHQTAEHAGLAGAGGGGAHRLVRIRGMPEIGNDLETAFLNLSGLGIFILINHIFFRTFLHQPPRLRLHPGAHKSGQVEPGIAIEHQVIVDQLITQIGAQALFRQAIAGDLVGQVRCRQPATEVDVHAKGLRTVASSHRDPIERKPFKPILSWPGCSAKTRSTQLSASSGRSGQRWRTWTLPTLPGSHALFRAKESNHHSFLAGPGGQPVPPAPLRPTPQAPAHPSAPQPSQRARGRRSTHRAQPGLHRLTPGPRPSMTSQPSPIPSSADLARYPGAARRTGQTLDVAPAAALQTQGGPGVDGSRHLTWSNCNRPMPT